MTSDGVATEKKKKKKSLIWIDLSISLVDINSVSQLIKIGHYVLGVSVCAYVCVSVCVYVCVCVGGGGG